MDKRTKQLFEWAASNSSTSTDPPTVPSSKLDPSIIDAILGPNDATLMVDSMKAINDDSLSLDDRFCPPLKVY
jgi:Nucleotide exchange factor Fes1